MGQTTIRQRHEEVTVEQRPLSNEVLDMTPPGYISNWIKEAETKGVSRMVDRAAGRRIHRYPHQCP